MQTKNETGSAEWTDPDDAPPLTAAMLDDAEFFHGNTFIKRGRGRPPTGNAKEHVGAEGPSLRKRTLASCTQCRGSG